MKPPAAGILVFSVESKLWAEGEQVKMRPDI